MTIAVLTEGPCCSQTVYGDGPVRRAADSGETDHASGSGASRWVDAPDDVTQMAAVYRELSADGRDLFDGRDTCGRGALSSHGGNGSQRPGRRSVETLWRRHCARPAAVEE